MAPPLGEPRPVQAIPTLLRAVADLPGLVVARENVVEGGGIGVETRMGLATGLPTLD